MARRYFKRTRRLFAWFPDWIQLAFIAILALGFFTVASVIAWASFTTIPSIDNFENRAVAQSTKIYDRTGNIVLYDVHGTMRRTAVSLEEISPFIQKATIAIEDASFYEHKGFRPLAFLRAIWINFTTGDLLGGQGGSTITQQVVKNALLTQDKKVTRKIKEIILAIRLERIYTKDQILSTYLNENPYGGTIYGVQEASQYFFGVDAKDVDLAEAAYLAALPQAPTRYSPYGNNRDLLVKRKDLVLGRMLEHGFITQTEHDEAVAEDVKFNDETDAGIKAPHFVFYIREYLESKYGVDAVNREGLRVITTLDYDLQKKAEDIIDEYAPGMEANFDATNESMVAVEPSSGQILTMVGSRGYFDETIDGKVNVAIAKRQPGSSFKPFVYATAFKRGYTPDTVVFDLQTQFSTSCQPQDVANSAPPCYSPGNYDGMFKGPMKLRDALAQSQNVPAVKTLYLAGINESLQTAKDLGISTLTNAGRYGLTLVLGGGEVTLLDMTSAYGVFANDGVRNPHTGILRVEDLRGNILEEYAKEDARVLEPEIARQINDILSDNEARTPEFGAASPLYFPSHNVADKTGTTNDFRDVWIVGYTPGISIGAWAGNNDNSPMQKRIAAFVIAPMWHEFMEYALEKYPSDDFVEPSPETNPDSLPPVLRGNWNTDVTRGVHDILYWVQKENPRSGAAANFSDSQFQYWDYPVQLWAAGQQLTNPIIIPVGTGSQAAGFKILSPAAGSYVSAWSTVVITATHPFPQSVTSVSYFVSGKPVGSATTPPYAISFVPTAFGPTSVQAVSQLVTGGQEVTSIPIIIQ